MSFDSDDYDFIQEEIARQKSESGYKVSRSSVVETALKLLKEHREKVQNAKVAAEKSNKADSEKAAAVKKKRK